MPRGRPRRVAVAPGTPAILESGLLTPLAVPVPVVAPLAVPPLASKETACAEAAWTQGNYGDVSDWTSRPTEATTVAPGPGIQIPPSVRQQIWRGEYINLQMFLNETRIPESRVVLPDGTIKEVKRRPLANIGEWTDAFMEYMDVYLQMHSAKLSAMIQYMRIIRFANKKWGHTGWLSYDEKFRQAMEDSPETPWDQINSNLWMLYVLPSLIPQSFLGKPAAEGRSAEGKQGGGARAVPYSGPGGGRQARIRAGKTAVTGLCHSFNKPGMGCTHGSSCKYAHRCKKCGKADHGLPLCKG